MSKKGEKERSQPEFFFVFDSSKGQAKGQKITEQVEAKPSELSPESLSTHREKLLAELREFGC